MKCKVCKRELNIGFDFEDNVMICPECFKRTKETRNKKGIIERLREYIELDREMFDYDEDSDFGKFCQGHCQDIDEVLCCIDEIKRYIHSIDPDDFEYYDTYREVYYHMSNINDIIKTLS